MHTNNIKNYIKIMKKSPKRPGCCPRSHGGFFRPSRYRPAPPFTLGYLGHSFVPLKCAQLTGNR